MRNAAVTIVCIGTGATRDLGETEQQAVAAAATLLAWIEPPHWIQPGRFRRLSAPPTVDRWSSELAGLSAPLTYLAPGAGPDDDPGSAVLESVLNDAGWSVNRLGGRGIDVRGPALVGPASAAWRPDPGKLAVIRGISDADELQRWMDTLRREFGPSVVPQVRPWDGTQWIVAAARPAGLSYPVTLRAQPTPESETRGIEEFRTVVETLRGPDGCPWDREQTHESLRPFLIEEAYECVAAIESGDTRDLGDELGDVLLQVGLHAEIARRAGEFTWPDVVQAITAKLIRRHPHVFGDLVARDAEHVMVNWQQLKRAERGGDGHFLDGVPDSLPSLAYAREIAARALRLELDLGLPSDPTDVLAGALAGGDGPPDPVALGDALLALALRAEQAGLNLEMVVRDANARLRARLQAQAEKA